MVFQIYKIYIVKLNLYMYKYAMLLGILDMYKLKSLLKFLYKIYIVKLNLYISKYPELLGIFDMYKLTVLLEYL
jgi:hypothetical protein